MGWNATDPWLGKCFGLLLLIINTDLAATPRSELFLQHPRSPLHPSDGFALHPTFTRDSGSSF